MRNNQCGFVISLLLLCLLAHYVIYNLLYDPNQYTTKLPATERVNPIPKSVAKGQEKTIERVNRIPSSVAKGQEKTTERVNRITSSVAKGFETVSTINSYNIVYYNMPSWMSLDFKVLNSTICPELKGQCLIYTQNKYLDSANAVLFYGESLGQIPKKKEGQIWTFFSIESPYLYSVGQQWKDKFSWTLTYRHDSDFKYLYGKVYKRETPLRRDYSGIFKNKTKNVAWAVSNCNTPSKRELYVKKLQQYIDVDIYGRCGKLKCGRSSAGITECHKKFAKEYKFFLAVENSVCKDYTTEKMFNFFFYDLAMIPIVNGPQNVHEYIPKGTFINILDYSSPSELANDLQRIGSNETLYSSYLREKDKYSARRFTWQNVLCPMCARLHERKQISPIPDINSWIWKDTCIKPKLV